MKELSKESGDYLVTLTNHSFVPSGGEPTVDVCTFLAANDKLNVWRKAKWLNPVGIVRAWTNGPKAYKQDETVIS